MWSQWTPWEAVLGDSSGRMRWFWSFGGGAAQHPASLPVGRSSGCGVDGLKATPMEADGKSSGPVSLATGPCSGDPGSANQTCLCAVWPLDQRGRVRILWEGCVWRCCLGAVAAVCRGRVSWRQGWGLEQDTGLSHAWPPRRPSLCLHRALHHALSQMENQTLPLLLAAGNPDPRRVELALTPRSSSS